jgi:predicted Zn-dependent peptidase
MKAGLLMGLESPASRAERLARLLQIWDRVPTLEETVARIESIGLSDVRRFAEHIGTQAPAALALYGPVDSAPSLAALQERRVA